MGAASEEEEVLCLLTLLCDLSVKTFVFFATLTQTACRLIQMFHKAPPWKKGIDLVR